MRAMHVHVLQSTDQGLVFGCNYLKDNYSQLQCADSQATNSSRVLLLADLDLASKPACWYVSARLYDLMHGNKIGQMKETRRSICETKQQLRSIFVDAMDCS